MTEILSFMTEHIPFMTETLSVMTEHIPFMTVTLSVMTEHIPFMTEILTFMTKHIPFMTKILTKKRGIPKPEFPLIKTISSLTIYQKILEPLLPLLSPETLNIYAFCARSYTSSAPPHSHAK
jgi:hypothetical protein